MTITSMAALLISCGPTDNEEQVAYNMMYEAPAEAVVDSVIENSDKTSPTEPDDIFADADGVRALAEHTQKEPKSDAVFTVQIAS